jgi:hypothetical protein
VNVQNEKGDTSENLDCWVLPYQVLVAHLSTAVHTDSMEGMTDRKVHSSLVNQFVSRTYGLTGKSFPFSTVFFYIQRSLVSSTIIVCYERATIDACSDTVAKTWTYPATVSLSMVAAMQCPCVS